MATSSMEAATLKEKLQKSRRLWNESIDSTFLVELYETLDCPRYDGIISWSDDGTVVLIRDSSFIKEEVLPYFETCYTLNTFLSKLKKNNFAKLPTDGFDAEYVFKHAYYSRDNRPLFETWEDVSTQKKVNKRSNRTVNSDDNQYGRKKIKYSQSQEEKKESKKFTYSQFKDLVSFLQTSSLDKKMQVMMDSIINFERISTILKVNP